MCSVVDRVRRRSRISVRPTETSFLRTLPGSSPDCDLPVTSKRGEFQSGDRRPAAANLHANPSVSSKRRESTERERFERDVLNGLQSRPKRLSPKYFYDEQGSRLFDEISQLDVYYLTRTELEIMQQHAEEIVDSIGPRALLVEFGSGSSLKTRILLDAMRDAAGYIPIDISREYLDESVARLRSAYPELNIQPIHADYTEPFELPQLSSAPARVIVYFPGSTIGNLEPDDAKAFLRHTADLCGENGALLIGVDLKKERSVIEKAYNDSMGVTAAFNKNILIRINRELEGTFDPDAFEHRAVYNESAGRVEMYLISIRSQDVRVAGTLIHFAEDESICTEHSYKYSLDEFAALLATAGFRVDRIWTDAKEWFSVQYCTVSPSV